MNEKRGSEKPGSENPGSENPRSEKPGSENPGREKPGSENPGSPGMKGSDLVERVKRKPALALPELSERSPSALALPEISENPGSDDLERVSYVLPEGENVAELFQQPEDEKKWSLFKPGSKYIQPRTSTGLFNHMKDTLESSLNSASSFFDVEELAEGERRQSKKQRASFNWYQADYFFLKNGWGLICFTNIDEVEKLTIRTLFSRRGTENRVVLHKINFGEKS